MYCSCEVQTQDCIDNPRLIAVVSRSSHQGMKGVAIQSINPDKKYFDVEITSVSFVA
jgi:hypothetical protein